MVSCISTMAVSASPMSKIRESVGCPFDIKKAMLTLRPTASGHFFSAGSGKLIAHIDAVLSLGVERYIPHRGMSGMYDSRDDWSKHFTPFKLGTRSSLSISFECGPCGALSEADELPGSK